jgi:shikimate kinase
LTAPGGLEEIRQLLSQRAPIYAACADLTIDTERHSPEHLARQIVSDLSLQEPA